jgi:hypothetical protein
VIYKEYITTESHLFQKDKVALVLKTLKQFTILKNKGLTLRSTGVAGKVLFLHQGCVLLIIIQSAIHLFCVTFCICILVYIKYFTAYIYINSKLIVVVNVKVRTSTRNKMWMGLIQLIGGLNKED